MAANDIAVWQRNAANTAWAETVLSPGLNCLLAFNASGQMAIILIGTGLKIDGGGNLSLAGKALLLASSPSSVGWWGQDVLGNLAWTTPTPDQIGAEPTTFLPLVTGLTGGGATNLDGQTTVGLTVPRLFSVSISDNFEIWKLRTKAGGDVVDGTSIVQPVDFNASTNNVVFVRIL